MSDSATPWTAAHQASLFITNSRSLPKLMSIELVMPSQVALLVKNPLPNAADVRDTGLIPGSGRSPGGGHGNPLQYSCLENSMDGGAWWATVHGLAKSRTQLSDFQFRPVHSRSRVWLFATPWTAPCQASLFLTNSRSLLKLMSIESMMPFNRLILCHSLFLIPSTFQVLTTIYLSSLDTLLLQYLKSQKMFCLMMELC